MDLRKCERRNFAACDAREIFLFLLFGAEKQQGLRNTDRLVGRNERSQIFVPASEQHRGPAIVDLRQA